MSLVNETKTSIFAFLSSPIQCTREKSANTKLQETSFCIYQQASLTVEAAVIYPLAAGFLLSILFFFRVLFVQAAVEEALVYAGRAVAVESSLVDDEAALFLSAEGLFKYALCQETHIEKFVMGGVLGVSLLGSDTSGKEIKLQADYMIRWPIQFFGVKGIWLTSKNSFVKWKGDLYEGEDEEKWVYVTKTGTVYHKNTSCRSLDLNIRKSSYSDIDTIRGKSGQRYYACKRCVSNLDNIESVYFTDYGKLYHGMLSCSALKRTIEKILFSQVGDRRPCSYCY